MHFVAWKLRCFYWNSSEFDYWGFIWQYYSGNGSAPNGQQPITRATYVPIYWRIYVSLLSQNGTHLSPHKWFDATPYDIVYILIASEYITCTQQYMDIET